MGNRRAFDIPPVVRRKAEVAGAHQWLDDLPDLVDDACSQWSLTVDGVLDDSTEALVLAVTAPGSVPESSTPAVLKICVPRDGNHAAKEIAVLRLAAGNGCAELLAADIESGRFLVERLGPALTHLDLPVVRRHEVMCAAAAALWRPLADADHTFMSGREKARWLIDFVGGTWERLGRPCSEAAVADAIACAERREAAHDDERSVLVHGDVHQWNTLQTLDGSAFKLIDPDGLLAEPEYDLGIIMREDPIELLTAPRERSQRLAALTGCDEQAIWEWGAIERVSTGLLAVEIGMEPVGREMLTTAEHVAALG